VLLKSLLVYIDFYIGQVAAGTNIRILVPGCGEGHKCMQVKNVMSIFNR